MFNFFWRTQASSTLEEIATEEKVAALFKMTFNLKDNPNVLEDNLGFSFSSVEEARKVRDYLAEFTPMKKSFTYLEGSQEIRFTIPIETQNFIQCAEALATAYEKFMYENPYDQKKILIDQLLKPYKIYLKIFPDYCGLRFEYHGDWEIIEVNEKFTKNFKKEEYEVNYIDGEACAAKIVFKKDDLVKKFVSIVGDIAQTQAQDLMTKSLLQENLLDPFDESFIKIDKLPEEPLPSNYSIFDIFGR